MSSGLFLVLDTQKCVNFGANQATPAMLDVLAWSHVSEKK
jgi:hypothetical protein